MPPRSRSGFTIVELIIVMVLMGLMMAIALPRMNNGRREADVAVTQIALAFEQAQRTAISRQRNVLVSIDTAGRRIRLLEDVNGNGALDGGERTLWIPLEGRARFSVPPVRLDGTPGRAALEGDGYVTLTGLPTIIMRRDGSASVAGEFYLSSQTRTVVDRRAVLLPRATAHAEWYRYDGRTWKLGTP